MSQVKVTIEAMNPVNKSNIDIIVQQVATIEGVSAARLIFDDQYKFRFVYEYDSSSNDGNIITEIKTLLDRYYSTILARTEDRSKADI